jgi:hypothetical protein
VRRGRFRFPPRGSGLTNQVSLDRRGESDVGGAASAAPFQTRTLDARKREEFASYQAYPRFLLVEIAVSTWIARLGPCRLQRDRTKLSVQATLGRIPATKVSRRKQPWRRAMTQTDQKKCAHVPCSCNASDKYCSQACQDAGSSETEIACQCGHPSCDAQVTA